jgi:xanthine/CO dehydrogenase XdhC/CoxF family maturation factor
VAVAIAAELIGVLRGGAKPAEKALTA